MIWFTVVMLPHPCHTTGIWKKPDDATAPGTYFPDADTVQHVVVMVGMPGAGKTTATAQVALAIVPPTLLIRLFSQLLAQGGAAWSCISRDDIYPSLSSGSGAETSFSESFIKELVDGAVQASLHEALRRGEHVAIDCCNFNTAQRNYWVKAANQTDRRCCFTALCLDVPPALCLGRIQQRKGHPRLPGGKPGPAEEQRCKTLHRQLTTPGFKEGFHRIVWLNSQQQLDQELSVFARVTSALPSSDCGTSVRLPNNLRQGTPVVVFTCR